MFSIEPIIEGFERLFAMLTGSNPTAPIAPTGADARDPACRPRTVAELTQNTAAVAVEALTRLYTPAASWWDAGAIQISAYTSADPRTAGYSIRSTTPGFEFDVKLNRHRLTPSYYDVAITLIHELAHIDHIRRVGFMPDDVAMLVSETEFVALAWQFELVAFQAQLAGAAAIRASNPTAHAECWQVAMGSDAVLAALQAGRMNLARREIKDIYPETEFRTLWGTLQSNTVDPAAQVKWLFFAADEPLLWGL